MLSCRASRGWGGRGSETGKALQCSGSSSSRVDQDLDVEASLVAVLLAVVDVLAKHSALDAQLGVQRQVGELQCHQGLLVLRVQRLAVVGVVLQWEATADAVVLDLTDFASIFFFLEGNGNLVMLSKKKERAISILFILLYSFYSVWKAKGKTARAYLVSAEDWDDVRLHFWLGLLRNAIV